MYVRVLMLRFATCTCTYLCINQPLSNYMYVYIYMYTYMYVNDNHTHISCINFIYFISASPLTFWLLNIQNGRQIYPPHILPVSPNAKLEWIG